MHGVSELQGIRELRVGFMIMMTSLRLGLVARSSSASEVLSFGRAQPLHHMLYWVHFDHRRRCGDG